MIKTMNIFMSNNKVIYNLPTRDKSNLRLTNTNIQKRFNPINQDFGDDFVYYITQINWSKMSKIQGSIDFGISVTKVSLKAFSIWPVLKKLVIAFTRSIQIICQNF